jgi:hypothetical protein
LNATDLHLHAAFNQASIPTVFMDKPAFVIPRGCRGLISGSWRAVFVGLALLCLSWPATSSAKKREPSYEVIVSVNEAAGTVVIGHAHGNNHSTKSLKIDKFTEITVDGQKAAIHELKAGMMVDVTLGGDADVAATLVATTVH